MPEFFEALMERYIWFRHEPRTKDVLCRASDLLQSKPQPCGMPLGLESIASGLRSFNELVKQN